MTTVPLPDVPCVRCRLIYTTPEGTLAGSRFYLSYSGSAPSGANCTTLAGDIAAAWGSHMAPMAHPSWALTEVDVLDIATDSGLSGQWTGTTDGSRTGTQLPPQIAANVEFDIGRRYRGGKPRMFWPPGNEADTDGGSKFTGAFLTAMNSAVDAFFTQVQALSIGSMGSLALVSLSYYKGFTNITNSSGRTRAVPTYRATALSDRIVNYSCKAVQGSQKRRRTSTTP